MELTQNPIQKSILAHAVVAGCAIALTLFRPSVQDIHFSLPIDLALGVKQLSKPTPALKPAEKTSGKNSREVTPQAATNPLLAPNQSQQASDDPAAGEKTYLSELRSWIEQHKRYPPQAKTLGHEGRSEIRFTVFPDGTIAAVALIKSSGSSILDQAALALLGKVRKLSPFPESLKLSRLDLVLPIEYSLN